MALEPGHRLGPYEIVAPIGAGGMGEVYRARDRKLNRDVAIKVLPATVAADRDRLTRLEREAQVLASLNHPHIGAIYGIEGTDRGSALILELVEGPTLADRLVRGSVPLADTIDIARQMAAALEAAHEQGVIHRDLKPANIKLRPDGAVKVLDFGLAKVACAPTLTPVDVSTETAMMTEAGIIVGTVAYMSPEQARGRPVDRRTDIWAFGCVMYEMLTGVRAFARDSAADILAAIALNQPDWDALPADTPAAIRLLLRRCLQTDVTRRLQHIGDARLELEDVIAGHDVARIEPAQPRFLGGWRAVPWAIAVALAVGLGVGSLLRNPNGAAAQRAVARLELNLPPGVDLDSSVGQSAALSPDGTQVAFVGISGGVRQLYLRRLDQFRTVQLPGTEQATSCFFSPDGRKIAFVLASGTLKTVSLGDATVTTVASHVNYTSGGTWGADDVITFSREGTLWQVPASGGASRQLTTLDPTKHELSHEWPTIVNNGHGILFASTTAADDAGQRIEALSFADHRRRVVVDGGTFPLYASGHLIYFRSGVLLAAPFDARRLVVSGSPVRVVEDVAATGNVPLATVSSTGSLLFAPNATGASRLVWVSRDGAEQPLNDVPRAYRHPRLSPDGRRLVVRASGDLWLQDLARGTFARLTSLGTVDGFIAWMPDAARVVFRTSTAIRTLDVDGGGRSAVVASTSAADYPNSVSPDGRTLAFVRMASTGDLHALSLNGERAPVAIVQTPAYEAGAQFSPDGRWIAYVSDESGQLQVYVRPYPSLDRKWQISTDGGTQVLWNRNGRELFYRAGNKLIAVEISTTPQLTLSRPRLLFERRYAVGTVTFANYDVAPDGRRFLMVRDESGSGRLNVVLNWASEL